MEQELSHELLHCGNIGSNAELENGRHFCCELLLCGFYDFAFLCEITV